MIVWNLFDLLTCFRCTKVGSYIYFWLFSCFLFLSTSCCVFLVLSSCDWNFLKIIFVVYRFFLLNSWLFQCLEILWSFIFLKMDINTLDFRLFIDHSSKGSDVVSDENTTASEDDRSTLFVNYGNTLATYMLMKNIASYYFPLLRIATHLFFSMFRLRHIYEFGRWRIIWLL